MNVRTRRLLAFGFILAFLVLAPLLILYALGYRYQWGKSVIQTATIVVSSVPSGAAIYLNNKPISNVTPTTVTGVTPGEYTVRLTKDGYRGWQKNFILLPEQAVFVSDIRLFADASPKQVNTTSEQLVSTSPDETEVLLTAADATGQTFLLLDTTSGSTTSMALSSSFIPDANASVRWAASGEELTLIDGTRAYLLAFDRKKIIDLNALVSAHLTSASWNTDTPGLITATNGKMLYSINVSTSTVTTNAPLPVLTTSELINDTWTANNALYQLRKEAQGQSEFVINAATAAPIVIHLPTATAYEHVATIDDAFIFLDDSKTLSAWRLGNGALLPLMGAAGVSDVDIDVAHGDIVYATLFEVWTYNIRSGSRALLTRLATPITHVHAFDVTASHVFFSTNQGIFAIERDARDVRNSWQLVNDANVNSFTPSADGTKLWFTKSATKGLYQLAL